MTDSSPENLEINPWVSRLCGAPSDFELQLFFNLSLPILLHCKKKNALQFWSSNTRQNKEYKPPENPLLSHTIGSLFPYCSSSPFQHRRADHYTCQSQRGEKKKSYAQMTNSGWCQVGLEESGRAGGGWGARRVCRRLNLEQP